jgi:hypothetical protein
MSSTATWNGSQWVWKDVKKDSDIFHLLKSGPLKAALLNLRKPGAKQAAPAPTTPVVHAPERDDAAR